MITILRDWASLNVVGLALWVMWVEYRRLLRGEVGR